MKSLQTASCLLLASLSFAQDRTELASGPRWLAHLASPDLTSLPGRWQYVSEFRQPAITSESFRRAAARVRAERERVREGLVPGYVGLERYYSEAAADGGQVETSSTETETVWIDGRDPATFAWTNEGGADEDRHLWQVCVLDDCVVSRSDSASGSLYQLAERDGDLPEFMHLFVQMRVHAAVAYYFVAAGSESDGCFHLDEEIIDSVMPSGFRMPLSARTGILRVQPGARGVALTASVFDAAGRAILEWESVWSNGIARELKEREFLEGTAELRGAKSVTLVSRTEVGVLPDPVSLALGPTEVATARDLRNGQNAREFDPRGGVPARRVAAASSPEPERQPASLATASVGSGRGSMRGSDGTGAAAAPEWVRQRLSYDDPDDSWITAVPVLGGLILVGGLAALLIRRRAGLLAASLLAVLVAGCGSEGAGSELEVPELALAGGASLWDPTLVSIVPEAMEATLGRGEVRRLRAHLVNNTEERLVLDRVAGTCGCIFTTAAVEVVEPFGTAILEVEAKAEDYAGSSVVNWHVDGDPQRAGETRMPITLRVR